MKEVGMGQKLVEFLQKSGDWDTLGPGIQNYLAESVHPEWDERIIVRVTRLRSGGEQVGFANAMRQVVGNNDPTQAPPKQTVSVQPQPLSRLPQVSYKKPKISLPKISLPKIKVPKIDFSGLWQGATEKVSEIRVRYQKREADPKTENPKTEKPSGGLIAKLGSMKESAGSWIKWIGIGIVILVVLIGGYMLITQLGQVGYTTPATVSQQLATPPAPPTQTPVDLAHVSWLSIVQATIVLLSLLTAIGLGVDAWNRGQISDFLAILFAIVMTQIHGLLATMFAGLLAWLKMNPTQLDWAFSLFCTGVALATAWWVTQQGGFDWTPLAGFFTLLGACGLLFGHMGSLQVLFNIPDAPVLPIGQVITLMSLKQTDQIGMSILTYSCLGIGALLYIFEMIRTIVEEIQGAGDQFFYAATSVIGLVVYFAFKNVLLSRGTPPMVVIVLAILAGAAGAFAYRVINKKSNTPVGQGEIRLRNAWIPAWDKLIVQIAIALFLIAMSGRII
jgi:hypothetical protein